MPDWINHAIWWQVYPLGFAGAPDTLAEHSGEPGDGLRRLTGWLDHLVELGGNGLLLNPIFTSMSHGYDTVDYFSVDPRLGTEEDFDALVAAARQRGVRVVLDGVFNHVGRDFPRLVTAMADGPDSEAARWFRWSTGSDGRTYPYTFEGHEQLVTLDHAEPAVRQLVGEVMRHWLGRGVDGWRLDATYTIDPAFWAAVLPEVRSEFGEAWVVGEMIHGDYADYVARSGIDSVTAYELWAAVWSSLENLNFFELDWTLHRHADLLTSFVPMTFVSNHDVSRLASQIQDPRHRDHAAALLFFLPGTPCVYYGDEYGMEGVKEQRLGGDDAVRPAMPGSAAGLDLPAAGQHTRDLYGRLIAMRRRQPWLVDAQVVASEVTNTSITVTATPRTGEGSRLRLQLNTGDTPVPLGGPEVVEAGEPVSGDRVAPHSWAITTG